VGDLLADKNPDSLAKTAATSDRLDLAAIVGQSVNADFAALRAATNAPGKGDALPAFNISDLTKTGADKSPSLTPGDHNETLQVEGKTRQFDVHIPAGYDGKSKLPVMYMLPGLTETKNMMEQYSQMNKVADQKGFAVVYLQALPQSFPGSFGLFKEYSWNLDHGTLTDKDPGYDDLNYFKAVKNSLEGSATIDPHRQYLAGFSEGGEAAQYIAYAMPHTFAGVATVHSTLLDSDPRPRANDPTAMISVLGDDDNILPLKGGHGWFQGGSLLKGYMLITVPRVGESQPLAQAPAWAAADGDHIIAVNNNDDAEITNYSGGSAPVEQIVRHSRFGWLGSQGGQHAWDGGDDGWKAVPDPDLIQDISKLDRHSDPAFDTSRTVADFLLQYSKP
jgi:poly(3-hydroxybutyrate) depolymerase